MKKLSECTEAIKDFSPFIQWCAHNGIFDTEDSDDGYGLLYRFLLEEAGKDMDAFANNALNGTFGPVDEENREALLNLLEQGTIYAAAKSNYELELQQTLAVFKLLQDV